jgi:flagellin
LSSGFRINSAKDDAAGLQISNRMTSQINGLNVAVRNANDGISVAQTAEGAMQESTNILQRMRDLSVQSANGANSSEDRASLQKEVDALQTELTRIAETTTFGGQSLLDGSYGTQGFLVGSEAGQNIDISLGDVSADAVGLKGKTLSGETVAGLNQIASQAPTFSSDASITFTLDGKQTQIDLNDGMSAQDIANKANDVVGLSNIGATTSAAVRVVDGSTQIGSGDIFTAEVNGFSFSATLGAGDTTAQEAVEALQTQIALDTNFAAAGYTATVVDPDSGSTDTTDAYLVITDSAGRNMNIQTSYTNASAGSTTGDDVGLDVQSVSGIDVAGTAAFSATVPFADISDTTTLNTDTTANAGGIVTGVLDYTNAILANDTTSVAVNAAGTMNSRALTASNDTANFSVGAADSREVTIEDIDISTMGGATSAIDVIDAAIASIDDQRSNLGATQNRLESTISNLTNISENVSAARSRIRDVDFAQETAKMSQNQILQQAGTTILAQANQLPQAALSLLG